jgi:quaternary ammonium compound-resistance protein SugE
MHGSRGRITGGIPVAWLYIVIAGTLEIAMAIALKESNGFSRPTWGAVFVVLAVASFGMLSLGLRTLPVGTAYAVWTGIGAAGTAIVGMIFLGESREIGRLVSIALIVSGVVGLRLMGGE